MQNDKYFNNDKVKKNNNKYEKNINKKNSKPGPLSYNSGSGLCALYRALSKLSVCSRKDSKDMILSGKITVNGIKAISIMQPVNIKKDKIALNGKIIKAAKFEYIAVNKPIGYETTRPGKNITSKTIYDVVPFALNKNLNPVGRLDKDSHGLIFLTNDNEFLNELTGDSNKITKHYKVSASTKLTDEQIEEFKNGILIKKDGGALEKTKPCYIKEIDDKVYDIKINQGINRQIRKMFEYFGAAVIDLFRYKIGNFDIKLLENKNYINIKPEEVLTPSAIKKQKNV